MIRLLVGAVGYEPGSGWTLEIPEDGGPEGGVVEHHIPRLSAAALTAALGAPLVEDGREVWHPGFRVSRQVGGSVGELLRAAEDLEADLASAAIQAGRGPEGLALNVAKTQVGMAVGALLRVLHGGAAVGSK